jgi:hypothetical protein
MSVPETSSAAKQYVALIVCSDDRAKTLAAQLARNFEIYIIKSNGANIHKGNKWEPIGLNKVPNQLDVLFFHTGSYDPERIPSSGEARLEFAFSGGEEPFTTRPKAHKIFPPFIGEQCPVDSAAVMQIIEMLEGKRIDPPSICMRPRTDSPLSALAVLCQGYLSVNAECGAGLTDLERTAVESALERMGWNITSEDQSFKLMLKNLSIHKRRVNTASWWTRPFMSTWGDRTTASGLNVQGFVSDLKAEWKRMGGDVSRFGKVRDLVLAFTQTARQDEPELTLATVAAAYSALADTLSVEALS